MAYVSQMSRDAMSTFQEVQIAKDATMMPTDRNIQIPTKISNVIYMNRKVLDVCIHKVSEIERVTFQFEKTDLRTDARRHRRASRAIQLATKPQRRWSDDTYQYTPLLCCISQCWTNGWTYWSARNCGSVHRGSHICSVQKSRENRSEFLGQLSLQKGQKIRSEFLERLEFRHKSLTGCRKKYRQFLDSRTQKHGQGQACGLTRVCTNRRD